MEPFISTAKIAGDLFGGFTVKIVAAGAAMFLASHVYDSIHQAFQPVLSALH